jgi:hypothetical protein
MNIPDEKTAHEQGQKVITDKEFSDLLREMSDINKKMFSEDKQMNFMMHIFTRPDFGAPFEPIVVFFDSLPKIGDEFSRYELLMGLGAKYYDENIKKQPRGSKKFPLACFFHSEAWMRIESPEDHKKHSNEDWGDNPRAGQKEAVVTFGMTMDKRVNMASMEIETKGKKRSLKEPFFQDWKEGNKMESPLLMNFYAGFHLAMMQDLKDKN